MKKVRQKAYDAIENEFQALAAAKPSDQPELLKSLAGMLREQWQKIDGHIAQRSDSWHWSERGQSYHNWADEWLHTANQFDAKANNGLGGEGFEVERIHGVLSIQLKNELLMLPEREFDF